MYARIAEVATVTPKITPRAEAAEIPTEAELKTLATEIAREYGVSPTLLHNLVSEESGWDVYAIGDRGEACGIVQIHRQYHPEEHKRCYDWDFALRFAAKEVAAGREWKWTSCSCIKTARLWGAKIPMNTNADELVPNTTPHVGAVAIFEYRGKRHAVYIAKMDGHGFTIKEGNMKPCLKTTRWVPWTDPALVGFYKP